MGAMESLIENVTSPGGTLAVDRRAGVIKNVKVLGLTSDNNQRYLPEAVRDAVQLYEGVRVNVDHPKDKPTSMRSAYDRFGKLENIRYVENEGLYGDLVFLRSHPMAERICEAAERMPEAFGLSHNCGGDGDYDKAGTFVVKQIVELRHVDIVADPATTKSLSESRKPKSLKEFAVMDELKATLATLAETLKEVIDKLDGSGEEVEEAYDDMKSEGEKKDEKKLEEADLEIEVDKEDEEKKQAMEGKTTKITAAALLQENRQLKARESVRQLCESAGIRTTSQLLADLALLPVDAAKRTITQLSIAAKAAKPKSSSPVLESKQWETAGSIPDGGDDLFNWIQN